MKMQITPEKALEYLDNAAKTYKGTRDDHVIMGASLQVLRGVLQDNADLRAKLEEVEAAKKLTPIDGGGSDEPPADTPDDLTE
ncbi:MAG: hypothetical protein CL819_01260 [Croceicoccus sp.]|nr:hypothetical protein [Croceicoccus sp.]